jgi:hypothetical protein
MTREISLAYRAALIDLIGLYSAGGMYPGPAYIASWSDTGGKARGATLDTIAHELATDYALGVLSWNFCDWAINNLNGLRFGIMDEDGDEGIFSRDFNQVYEAFDASEWVEPAVRDAKALKHITEFLSSVGIVVTSGREK